MSNGALVMPYRPSTLLSNIALRHQATDSVLGNPVVGHARFDYKPWVENQVARAGAPGISWTYHWRPPATHADSARAIIWRTSQTSGGVGIQLTSDMPDPALWTSGEVVASSAYLEEARPLNVSGVVYRTGALRLHPLSMQLVGIPSCTHEELGYCGNDFGAVSTLRRADLQAVEEVVTRVGRWLCSTGYVGAFGVDLLLHEDAALFVELNPRFQGSSRMSSAIAQEHGCVDIFLDHLCAALDLDPPGPPIRLDEWSDLAGARAQIVVHNTSDVPVTIRERALAASASTATTRFIDAPPEMLPVVPGGVQCRIELRDRATTSGKDLTGIAAGLVAGARAWFEPASGTPSP
jgi:hypothetical protein